MKYVSLSLVQTFYAVAKTGSFSAAARALGITYQSAANHVRRLEQIVGSALISSEQGAKSVELSSRAKTLFKLLEPELDVIFSRLSHLLEKERPVLRVGVPQAIFYYLLPPLLDKLRAQFPEIEIVAYERDTALTALVKDGSLDICLSERYFGDEGVPQHLIATYHLSLVFPKNWGKPPSPIDVPVWATKRPFITYEPGQIVRSIASDYLTIDDQTPAIAVSASGSSSIKQCVEAGLGFAVIPSWCVDARDTHLHTVRLDNLPAIPVYFGEASFLTNNQYVKYFRHLCSTMFPKRFSGEGLG